MYMQRIITTMKLNFRNVLQEINLDLFDLKEHAQTLVSCLVIRRNK